MLGRRPGQGTKTLRLGSDRLRIGPWTGEADTGQIILLTPGTAVADSSAAAAIEAAAARGFRRMRTSALSSYESEPFLRAGFQPCQQLALLTRPIPDEFPVPDGNVVIQRARRRDHPTVLAVDNTAFDPFWQLDQAGLHDALRATPHRYFRVVRQNSGAPIAGYAISGRSGPSGYLQRLAVAPDQQGHGTGAALVIDGLAWMARWGVTQVWVNTPHHNTSALRLYERLGFEPVTPGLQVLELTLDV